MYGFGLTIDRYGGIYLNLNTGTITPIVSVQGSMGWLTSPVPDPGELSSYLSGAGGALSFGQFYLGAGLGFSNGQTALVCSAGTPQLPGGSGGYSWRIR
jgi:hypothetical protein